eukprot:GHVH01004467.1.p1 GENE.GHVH01004467.1~~GHVH01004467.1.p1  ORF type:complete len:399 (+),score=32.27 GHVH01004467.1:142-1338(+)
MRLSCNNDGSVLRNEHGRYVAKLICARTVVELMLGSSVRILYKMQPNIALNLCFSSVGVIWLSFSMHKAHNKLTPKLLPGLFGHKWILTLSLVRDLILPTTLQCVGLLLKQMIIKFDGLGYAEMLMEIGVPLQCLIQYYINNQSVGYWGVASCVFSACCFALCLPICSTKAVVFGLLASSVSCLRCSLVVSANRQHDNAYPDLNLTLQGLISLPIYCAVVAFNSRNNWGQLEYETLNCLSHWVTFLYIICAWMSNLVVFGILDIASPFTYQIASQMKGSFLTAWDLFYVDFGIVWLLCIAWQLIVTTIYVPWCKLFLTNNNCSSDVNALMQPMKNLLDSLIWRKAPLSLIGIIAFILKCFSSIAYLIEKRNSAKSVRKIEEEAYLTIACCENKSDIRD